MRQAGNMTQLASSTPASLPSKRSSNSGVKDHILVSGNFSFTGLKIYVLYIKQANIISLASSMNLK